MIPFGGFQGNALRFFCFVSPFFSKEGSPRRTSTPRETNPKDAALVGAGRHAVFAAVQLDNGFDNRQTDACADHGALVVFAANALKAAPLSDAMASPMIRQ